MPVIDVRRFTMKYSHIRIKKLRDGSGLQQAEIFHEPLDSDSVINMLLNCNTLEQLEIFKEVDFDNERKVVTVKYPSSDVLYKGIAEAELSNIDAKIKKLKCK